MSEYIDARSARQFSNNNELDTIMELIKIATKQGKRKVRLDYKITNTVTETKLGEMGYEMWEDWENTNPNLTESQFMNLMTEYSFTRKNKPSFITHTVIQW